MQRTVKNVLALLLLFGGLTMKAEVKLPSIIGSNMVLQRNSSVNLWGEATPGRWVEIKTSWNKSKTRVRADGSGHWSTKVKTTEAGGPYEMTFSDGRGKAQKLTGILLGEVWVCSGQSNMEMPMQGFISQPVKNGIAMAMEANRRPNIRLFAVPRCMASEEQTDCDTCWQMPTVRNVRTFSAIAYLFGRELYDQLNVPIGLVATDWGGTVIEAWMNKETLKATPYNKEAADKRRGPNRSTVLWNGMVAPIAPFSAKGFIWYQGESNRSNWYDYKDLQVAMVKLWRKAWQSPNMPFYITQIAPYRYEGDALRGTPLFVDQQWAAADELDHCDVICTTDIGEYGLIHPANKLAVSQRLAWAALSNDYHVEGFPAHSPRFKSMETKGNKLVLSFTNLSPAHNYNNSSIDVANSLVAHYEPKGFEIAGADRKFYPARGRHLWFQNVVEVWSDSVKNPVAVRYAYHNYTNDANLVTITGLAVPSFRTDDWEMDDTGLPKK